MTSYQNITNRTRFAGNRIKIKPYISKVQSFHLNQSVFNHCEPVVSGINI